MGEEGFKERGCLNFFFQRFHYKEQVEEIEEVNIHTTGIKVIVADISESLPEMWVSSAKL